MLLMVEDDGDDYDDDDGDVDSDDDDYGEDNDDHDDAAIATAHLFRTR